MQQGLRFRVSSGDCVCFCGVLGYFLLFIVSLVVISIAVEMASYV